MILGIDEVGRGPWAGPLVVGAVVLPDGVTLDGLTDSKKLSAKRRLALDAMIREQALGFGLGWVHADELDAVGLSAALRLATIRAVEAVKVPYHEIIIDGTINFLKDTTKGQYVTTLPKADYLIPAVSAASIIAKVARDAYMEAQALVYPEYGFETHVGYGTAKHSKALSEHGVTVLHRTSFAPIAKIVNKGKNEGAGADRSKSEGAHGNPCAAVTAKSLGDDAEEAIADWLSIKDFSIRERNWKTKYCEIDIIAETDATRYFIEVKYRSSLNQGGGLAAITQKKLQQMRFAAELYTASQATKKSLRLAVAAVDAAGGIELLEVE